jgi:photosystem II stability/assembly factor-like uncharacterized protein
MMTRIFLPWTILALLLSFLLSGCDEGGSPSGPPPPSITWEVTSLAAGTVDALAVNNAGVLFASIDGDGIYKTIDNGVTWTKPMNGPFQGSSGSSFAQCLLADGYTLWAGTESAGIHRSTDEGTTWAEVPATPVPVGHVHDLCTARETVFCAAENGVFVLTQEGQWRQIDTRPVHAVCGDNTSNAVYAGGSYVISSTYETVAAILWSPVQQGGWYATVVSSGYRVNSIAQAPNGTHYASTYIGDMLRRDARTPWWSWEPIIPGPTFITNIVTTPTNEVFIVRSESSINLSTDNGDSWAWCMEGLTRDHVHTLAINPAGYIFAGTNEGVFRATY